jgi:hypothetical protein
MGVLAPAGFILVDLFSSRDAGGNYGYHTVEDFHEVFIKLDEKGEERRVSSKHSFTHNGDQL